MIQVCVGLKGGLVQIYSQKHLVDQFYAPGMKKLKIKYQINFKSYFRYCFIDLFWSSWLGRARLGISHQ